MRKAKNDLYAAERRAEPDSAGGMSSITPLGPSALTEEMISERLAILSEQPPQLPPSEIHWRRAAVLVPLLLCEGEWRLLFIRRTQTVETHRGQVAFPGGSADAEDRTLEDTALREAFEEIGLPPEKVKILGRLPDFYTISDFVVAPVVAVIPWPFAVRRSVAEVDRVFTIPLGWMADREHFEERPFARFSGKIENVVFFNEYDGEVVWGLTGLMTHSLLQALGLLNGR
jgi:8-oxo-dGTP pyrophosphatase MutT (NUDIX family)